MSPTLYLRPKRFAALVKTRIDGRLPRSERSASNNVAALAAAGAATRSMFRHAKQLMRRLPLIHAVYVQTRGALGLPDLPADPTEAIFLEKIRTNAWNGTESISGNGSDFCHTRSIAAYLPRVLRDVGATTMLDIPCGDFNWMRTVNLRNIHYIGADIVAELVRRNQRYASEHMEFRRLNLLSDPLPRVDVVFCRDCLVHLSFADALRALANICESRSTYLLTTTFPDRPENRDIATGRWRVLNLERAPFGLPPPERLISEEYAGDGGLYQDKSLGLWTIDTIRRTLQPHLAQVAPSSIQSP